AFRLEHVPLQYLVPRLHYRPHSPPDEFDAFNLLLAEYARNSIAMPMGEPGENAAHFETDLPETRPWTLKGDFQFVANPEVRPLRFSVINNCLTPGLWELAASDRAGEIYHAWFDFQPELYAKLVAEVNGVDRAFAAAAVKWRTVPVALD